MSVYLDGNLFPSVDFSDNATTVVSRPVARNLRIPLDKRLLLTTVVPGHPPFSTLVTVKFSKNPSADITLGSEWAGHLRESLILSGQAPGPGFVARQFLFPSIPNLAAGPSVQPSLHPVSANVSPGTSRQDSNYSSGRGGCFAHVDDHNGLPDLNAQYYASGSSPRLSSLAPDSVPDARANSPFGFDASITCLLLTSGQSPNVFSASLPVLKTLMRSHHIPFDGALTVPDALHAILSHLLSGLCVGFCPDSSEESQHRCRCSSFASVYGSRQSMAFESLSLIMSASVDRLPDNQFEIVCVALGLQFTSRVDCLNELGKRRAAIISQHAASNPILALFEKLDTLPKGTLVSVAQSHGLDPRTLNRENLLVNIWNHIGTGKCYRDEGQQSHLACSAASELDTDEDGWDHADPSVRIQIQILRQLGPILRTAPLRRLLELHNVSYVESDKVKVLRKRLKKFLYGLYTGKPSTEHGVGTRRAQYARAEARLREQWPQVIPDHLKRKLLANFRFETSTQALSTFVCGSCAERVPDAQYSTLCLKDFDLDLLSKPRYVPAAAADASHPPRAPSYDDDEELGSQDSDSEHSDGSYDPMDVDENFEPRVWLDGRCPQPPMPRDGLSHSSLLVEPDCLIQDTDTGDTAIVCMIVFLLSLFAIETILAPFRRN
ncbi:hypothetical protein DFH06DRAFT_1428225 [Mycena polygramma]|nr:hypothetical protein DFH06DRAFT_1428225 [Mycena polygramma]